MAYAGSIAISANIGGDSYSGSIPMLGDGVISVNPALPGGFAGTLTTRTEGSGGDHAAIATCAGHNIITGDIVDVYFTAGVQYSCEATVSGTAITLANGLGTHFPAQTAAVVVSKAVAINVDFEPDDLDSIVLMATVAGHAHFTQEGASPILPGTSIMALSFAALYPWFFKAGIGIANPLTGPRVGVVMASTSGLVAGEMHINGAYDATPSA